IITIDQIHDNARQRDRYQADYGVPHRVFPELSGHLVGPLQGSVEEGFYLVCVTPQPAGTLEVYGHLAAGISGPTDSLWRLASFLDAALELSQSRCKLSRLGDELERRNGRPDDF